MKLIQLQGGLGNQMFQYAVVRALETNKKKDIYLDLTFLEENNSSKEGFTARNYELNIFANLRAQKLNKQLRRLLFSKKKELRLTCHWLGLTTDFVNQSENEFVQIPNRKNICLSGFFQSEKYFKHIKSDLIHDFMFPKLDSENELLKNKIINENSVSIHVRRGDYIKSQIVRDYHGILGLSYYKYAISILKKEASEKLTFYIFSEDEEYVKDEFNFLENYTYVGGNIASDSWKDMCLMKSCKHHIIANSSFSWWGAWLSERKGLTIAPNNWFNRENVSFDIDDFIPADWVKI